MKDAQKIDIVEAIDNLTYTIQEEGMGIDDVYGFTPNSNLGSIAARLWEISKTLEKIADIMTVNTELD